METFDRRTFLKAGAGALLACGVPSLLTGCSKSSGSGSASTLQLANDKPTWHAWFQSEGEQAKTAVGASWTPQDYSNEDAYTAAVKTSAGSSKAPDMFTWQPSWGMKDVVDAGLVADLSSQWDKEGSAYSQGLRDMFSFNGTVYGAPLYSAPWPIFYNKSVFAKYTLQPPTTWSEMQQVMETLKKNGVAPLGATVDGVWSFVPFQTLLVARDPTLYNNLLAGKAKYTDPGVVEVMNLWADMMKKGYFTDPSSITFSTRGTNFATPFKQGKAAMAPMGTWYEATLKKAGLTAGTDYGAFTFPAIKSGAEKAIVIESGPLCAAARGKHEKDAVKAVGWFMSKAGQQEWVKQSGLISGRSDVPATSQVDQQILSDMKSGGYKQVSRYYDGTPHDIVLTAIDQFQKFQLHPGDPTSILNTIQSKADSVWKTVKQ